MKISDITLVLICQKQDTQIELEDALLDHFDHIISFDAGEPKYHHLLSIDHKNIIFVYAFEDIEIAKKLCEQIHNDDFLGDLYSFPNSDFLLCPVGQAKNAFNACRNSYFQDYSTMHPIYDKWNLILRFSQIMELLTQTKSKSDIEMRFKKLRKQAKNLVDKIKSSPYEFKSFDIKLKNAIGDASDKIVSGVSEISKEIGTESNEKYISIHDQSSLDSFFNKCGKDIKEASLSKLNDLNHEITVLAEEKEIGTDMDISNSTGQKIILLVDDEPFIAQVLNTILKQEGYILEYINGGAKFLKDAENLPFHPDTILMDIDMPQVNGLQVLKEIKNKGIFASTPVIMLTGYSDKRVIRRAMELGSDDYMVKPVKKDILVAKLNAILN